MERTGAVVLQADAEAEQHRDEDRKVVLTTLVFCSPDEPGELSLHNCSQTCTELFLEGMEAFPRLVRGTTNQRSSGVVLTTLVCCSPDEPGENLPKNRKKQEKGGTGQHDMIRWPLGRS